MPAGDPNAIQRIRKQVGQNTQQTALGAGAQAPTTSPIPTYKGPGKAAPNLPPHQPNAPHQGGQATSPFAQPTSGQGRMGGVQLVRDNAGNITPKWIGAPKANVAAGSGILLKQAHPEMMRHEMPSAPPPPEPATDAALQAQLEAQGGQQFGIPGQRDDWPALGQRLNEVWQRGQSLDFSSPDALLNSATNAVEPISRWNPTLRGTFGSFLGNPVVQGITTGFGAGMGTGFLASLVLGPEVFLPVAAVTGAVSAGYAIWKGQKAFEESILGKVLSPLGIPYSLVKKGIGTAEQIIGAGVADLARSEGDTTLDKNTLGSLSEVLGNMRATWEAGDLAIATWSPMGLVNVFNPQAWTAPDMVLVDFDLPNAPNTLVALTEARRRIGGWNGTPPEDPSYVVADISARYGLPGMARELIAPFTGLDPMMHVELLSTHVIGLSARMVGNEELAQVAHQMLTPHERAWWTPDWMMEEGQVRKSLAVPEGQKRGIGNTISPWFSDRPHGGIAPTVHAYENYLVSQKVFRSGFEAGRDLSNFERFIIGSKALRLAEGGGYVQPTWSKANPLSWLTYLMSETPESSAREAVYQFSNNVQSYLSSLDWNDPGTPERVATAIRGWRDAAASTGPVPDVFPEGGHIPYTIEGRIYGRVLPVDAIEQLVASYAQTRDMAQGLNAMADALGITPKAALDRMGDPESLTALINELKASGQPGMEVVTPESLNALYKVFAIDKTPLDGDMFHAATVEKMMESAGLWATQTFGIKSTGLITRFAAAVKAAESAALLGLNITYPVRNALNNEVMLAIAGAWGLRDVKSILSEFDRAGLSPARLEQGFAGAIDLNVADDFQHWGTSAVEKGMHPITEATRAGGKLEQFRDYVSHFTSKLPATRAAQWAERTQSARAYYSGFKEWMSQVWHRSSAIPPMEKDLEAALAALDPRLPNAVMAAAETGLNPKEISAAIFDKAPVLNTSRFVSDVASRLGLGESDVRRLLAVDGLGDWLDQKLAALGPDAKAGDVGGAFREARDKAENALNVLAAQEIATAAEHAAAVVQAEGPAAIMDLFGNVEQSLYETYSAHAHALSLEWDEIGRANPYIRDVLFAKMRQRSANTWERFFGYERAVYDGIAKGIESTGYQGFSRDAFMKVIDAKRSEIDLFHKLKDQVRDQFFRTKFRNAATRDAAWAQVETREADLYNRLIDRLERKQAKLDNYLVSWAKHHAGDEYGQRVQAWRQFMAQSNFADMRDVAEFRRGLAGLDRNARNAEWLRYQNTRLRQRYIIAQQGLTMLNGLGAAPQSPRSPLPVGGELKPGTWWQDVARRYELNYVKKDGTPHWQHFVRAVNKYLEEPIFGTKIRLSQAEIDGIPAPDRLGLIVDALQKRAEFHADEAARQAPPVARWEAPPTAGPSGEPTPPTEPAPVPGPTPNAPLAGGPGAQAPRPTPAEQVVDPAKPNTLWHVTRDLTTSLKELGWGDEQIAQMPEPVATGYAAARKTPQMVADDLARGQAPEARLRGQRPGAPAAEVPTSDQALTRLSQAAQQQGRYPGKLQVEYNPHPLTAPQRMAEARFAQYVENNTDQAVAAYWARMAETGSPNVLNVDEIRKLSPDFLADPAGMSSAVHEPASALAKEIWRRVLASEDPDGVSDVTFMAGGSGAGKSSANKVPEVAALLKGSQAVFDGTLSNYTSAKVKIEQALAAGKLVYIVDVYRDPVDSMVNGVISRIADEERIVPLETHIAQHVGARDTVLRLAQEYKDNSKVKFYVVDNSRGHGNQALESIDWLTNKGYDESQVRTQLLAELEKAHADGRITDNHYRAILGDVVPGENGLPQQPGAPRGTAIYGAETNAGPAGGPVRTGGGREPSPVNQGPAGQQAPAEVTPTELGQAPPTEETRPGAPGLGTNGGHPGNLITDPNIVARYHYQGGETVRWTERGPLGDMPVTAHVSKPQAPGEGSVWVERDGISHTINTARIDAINTNAGLDIKYQRWAESISAEPPTVPQLPPPIRPDIQEARNATAAYMEMQQAAADLIEPPSDLFRGTQYIIPGVPEELVNRSATSRPLWDLTLDERMALERQYVYDYQTAMGRPVEGSFTPEMVKRVIQDHKEVVEAAVADPDVGLGGVREDVFSSLEGKTIDEFVKKFADSTSIPGEPIGKTLGRNGKKVTTPPVVEGGTMGVGEGGANVPERAATKRQGIRRGGKPGSANRPGPADQGPLAPVSTPDVGGPETQAPVPTVGVRGAGANGGQPGEVSLEGNALRPGLGVDTGGVGTPAGRGASTKSPVRPRAVSSPARTGLDYIITPDDHIGVGGPRAKFQANIDAINTLKAIEAEQRLATPAEQQILVKYTGWGGLSEQAFGYRNEEFSGLRDTLGKVLTDEEFSQARASTNNSHYTSPLVLSKMWNAIRRLGWDGGRMAEPAAGIGHFFGTMPPDLAANASRVGVEIDSITARIARQLYQSADIRHVGFEDTHFPNKFFDLTTSNVPFSPVGVFDPAFGRGRKALTAKLHDYYFAKALDITRPGGLIAFITSEGTLDKLDPYVRQYIAERADLLGAIRLPNTAFKDNARTQVTTDIIFLKVREEGATPGPETFANVVDIATSDNRTLKVNEYYQRHPEMMLGHMELTGSMYRADTPTLEPFAGQDMGAALDAAVERLPQNIYGKPAPTARVPEAALAPQVSEIPGARENSFQVQDGKVYRVENGKLVPSGKPTGGLVEQRITGLAGIRDTARQLLDEQRAGTLSDADLAKLRASLNKKYDTFTKKYGNLHAEANVRAFSGDPDRNFVVGLERYDQDTGKIGKSTIFERDTSTHPAPLTSVATAKDALVASLNEKGRLDLEHMSQLLGGRAPEDIGAELVQAGIAYHNPEGNWEPADMYLSGNVRTKLAAAEAAAKIEPAYQANVDALRPVQPVDIPANEITAHLGAPWIHPEYIKQWIEELLPSRYRLKSDKTQVLYLEGVGQWSVKLSDQAKESIENVRTWATPRRTAVKLIQDALDQKATTVKTSAHEINLDIQTRIDDLVNNGAARGLTPQAIQQGVDGLRKSFISRTVNEAGDEIIQINPFATNDAREMQAKIKNHFADWIYADEERAANLARTYNDKFNAVRLRQFDGSHLSLPGVASEFLPGADRALRPHQLNAIWRMVSSGQNTLLAHVVGAGKTYEMIAAGMELRRLGLARKPMYVVPNHLLAQWSDEFSRMYPNSNILVAGKDDFQVNNMEALFTKIATNDWDAVIVPQSSFERIPVSAETWNGYVHEQLADLEDALIAARAQANEARGGGRDMTVKALEQAKKDLIKKLKEVNSIKAGQKTQLLNFEELGVDQLFVDEAHAYKNLMYTTKMQRVKGLGTAKGSGRAFDMFVKTQYLTKLNNGKGVVFATGTPISNSLIETYTMQRFMQLGRMRDLGIANLDAWAANFGDIRTEMGVSVDGQTYQPMTGMYAFNNAPELIQLFRDFADVKTADELKLPVPLLEGGSAQPVAVPSTPELVDYINKLVVRANAIRAGEVRDPHVDNMLKISGEGRKGALDMRLLDPNLPDNPNYKVNQAARRIYDIWKSTRANKSTQLVFVDFSTPKGAKIPKGETAPKFSVYDDLRAKLIKAGIPKNEIAFIHSYESDADKIRLFQDVNNGRVRVLLGSTEKMGAGTNVQKLLIAEHHLDAPWRPGDVEQRDGRILRWGNDNPKVAIYRYLTEGSFDAFMWDKIKTKAQFIARIMKGDITERTLENTDAVVLSASEMSAVASGNPLVGQKYAADAEVARLNGMEIAYRDRIRTLNRDLQVIPNAVSDRQAQVAAHQKAYSYWKAHRAPEGKFNVTIGNTAYTDLGKAGERLLELHGQAEANAKGANVSLVRTRQVIGTIDGFELGLQADVSWSGARTMGAESRRVDVVFYLKEPETGATYFVTPTATNEGTARKLSRTLEDIPVTVAGLQDQVNQLASDLAKVQAEASKPFEQAAKLAAARAKQAEINAQLMPPDQPGQQGPDDGQLVTLNEEPTPPEDLSAGFDTNGVGGGDANQNAVYNLPGLGNFVIEGWDPVQGGYVVRRLDDNTVHIIGRQQEEAATFVGAGQFDQAAGGAPMPRAAPSQEAWYGRLVPLLDEMQRRMETETRLPAIRGVDQASPEVRQGLQNWVQQVAGAQAESKLGGMKWGEFRRDLAMLNYSRRYNIDTLLSNFMPYEFWMTHSLAKWALHTMDRPALLANYYRISKFLNTAVTRPGFPTRLAGKVRIPIPWMPQWMGGAMYIDPLMIGLPLKQFALPFQQAQDQTQQNAQSTAYAIQQGMKDGTIPMAEGQQSLATQAGPVWNQALAQVQASSGDQQDAIDFAQMMMSPHLPLTWALAYMRGKQNTIGPLPLTRQLKAITALTGIGPAGGINLESGIRQSLNLPVFDQWEDYRIDRTLADMAAEGVIDAKTAEATMIGRSGPVYEMAAHRAAVQSGFGTVTSFVFGTSAPVYPEGEHKQRDLSVLFKAARSAQDAGDTKALENFFQVHPEYAARLALTDTPQKRLQNFLVDQVWTAWNNLPDLYRKQVQAEFGDNFNNAFLSKETRNYESIPPEMLAAWARTLGQYVPANVAGSPLPIQWAPPQIAQQAQEFYDSRKTLFPQEEISALQKQYFAIPSTDKVAAPVPANVQAFLDTVEKNFPGIQDLWTTYDNIATSKGRAAWKKAHPQMAAYDDYMAGWKRQNKADAHYLDSYGNYKGNSQTARSVFLSKYPILTQYWDWRRSWLAQHPEVGPYLSEVQQTGQPAATSTTKPTSEPTGIIAQPETQRVITSYLFSGAELPMGVRAKLNQVYLQQQPPAVKTQGAGQPPKAGVKPKTFDQWLLEIMAYGGNLEGPAAPAYNPPVAQPGPAPVQP